MSVTAVRKDPAALTMTLDAEFDASAERVWQLWADPRQLERWWGPPTYPRRSRSTTCRPAAASSIT
ncbi:MAG TPA: SRPBCC domain-containing protein [Longimicrobiales bacterium]